MKNEQKTGKQPYVSPKIEKIAFDYDDIIFTSRGNAEVGSGRGQGGGCDGVPYHRPGRTFTPGRNTGC